MQVLSVAKALVLDEAGNMLILHRSETHPTQPHAVDLPGGIVDPGEDFGQALLREIQEETGLTVTLDAIQPIYSAADVYKGRNWVRIFYFVRVPGEKPAVTISWEHEKAEWLPIERLMEFETIEREFIPFYQDAIRYVQEHDLL